MVKKRKAAASVEHRLTRLEDGLESMGKVVEDIKLNVTNHIPTSIAEVKEDLQVLLDRKKVSDAIKGFASNFFKIAVGMASIIWVLLQVVEHLYTKKEAIARILLNS